MEMCNFKQAAREADVAARLTAKRPALGNLTNLPMSAPSPPSSSSSWGPSASSLSSYAVRADPHSPAASFSCATVTAAPAACRFPQLMDYHSYVTSCPRPLLARFSPASRPLLARFSLLMPAPNGRRRLPTRHPAAACAPPRPRRTRPALARYPVAPLPALCRSAWRFRTAWTLNRLIRL